MKKRLTTNQTGSKKVNRMNDQETSRKSFATKEFADRVESIRSRYGSLSEYFSRNKANSDTNSRNHKKPDRLASCHTGS
jgi:hypothetical protein